MPVFAGLLGHFQNIFAFWSWFGVFLLLLCLVYMSFSWIDVNTPMFEQLPAVKSFLHCSDVGLAYTCLRKNQNQILLQSRKLMSLSAYGSFRSCLHLISDSHSDMELVLHTHRCYHAAVAPGNRQLVSPTCTWLVALLLAAQAITVVLVFSVAKACRKVSMEHMRSATNGEKRTFYPHSSEEDAHAQLMKQTVEARTVKHKASVAPGLHPSVVQLSPNVPLSLDIPTIHESCRENTHENAKPTEENEPRPSFHISSPEGRRAMKQYMRRKMEARNIPGTQSVPLSYRGDGDRKARLR